MERELEREIEREMEREREGIGGVFATRTWSWPQNATRVALGLCPRVWAVPPSSLPHSAAKRCASARQRDREAKEEAHNSDRARESEGERESERESERERHCQIQHSMRNPELCRICTSDTARHEICIKTKHKHLTVPFQNGTKLQHA